MNILLFRQYPSTRIIKIMKKSRCTVALSLYLKENRLLQFNYGAKLRKIIEITKYLCRFLCPGQKF